MRLARLGYYPAAYQRAFYAARPEAADLPYAAQLRALFDDAFAFADSWSYWLGQAGVPALDLPYGVAPLDRAYAAEAGIPPEEATPMRVAVDQLRRFRPEVLYLSSIEAWSAADVDAVRAAVPSVRAVLGMAGVDVYHAPALRRVDAFVTCLKGLAARLRTDGAEARFMAHAFDPRLVDRLTPATDVPAFAFFGNVASGAHWHDRRREILESLVADHGLVPYSAVERRPLAGVARALALSGAHWAGKALARTPAVRDALPFAAALRRASEWPAPPRWPRADRFGRQARPPLYGLEMYRRLAGARLTVNVHIGSAGPFASNMRLFEATGAGVCLLTDAKTDLGEFFAPGAEVVAFDGPEDAADKARALLADPRRTAEIAARGRERTLRDHGYAQRVPVLLAAAKAGIDRASA